MMLLLLSVVAMASVGYCDEVSDYVITEEAWFDIKVKDLDGPGQDYTGRFVVGLFGDAAPMTVLNFASIAKSYKKGKTTLTYKNCPIHRVVQDFVIQMGDITLFNGNGGTSIYGERFDDEGFLLSHRSAGMVAMANHGENTNGSQFYILLNKSRWLDGKHVVFGKVIQGMDVVRTIGDVPAHSDTAKPKNKITITDSGVTTPAKPYTLTEEQIDSPEDL